MGQAEYIVASKIPATPSTPPLTSLIDDDGDGTRHSCCCPLDDTLNLIILWGQVEWYDNNL